MLKLTRYGARLLAVALACSLAACATSPRNTVYQTSTIDALLAGVYEGEVTCRQLMKHGDFGIGTFQNLDGELFLNNGRLLQIKSDGKVYQPDADRVKTPFATVCQFQPEKTFALRAGSTFTEVEKLIDEQLPNKNLFQALRITGKFKTMHTRSVPCQRKPYPPLHEVTKNQPEFHITETEGVIVGFRSPAFVKGINVPGYHLHYVDKSASAGGHVLGFEIIEARCEVDTLHQFKMRLPVANQDFASTNLAQDRSADLEKVEKAQR